MSRSGIRTAVAAVTGALAAGAVAVALWQAPQGVAQEQQPLLEYPAYPPTPTVGAPPAVAPAVAGAALFQTSFDTPEALDAWQLVDLEFRLPDGEANWVVTADGRLEQDETGRTFSPSIHETAALTGASDWQDYTVQVSFYDQTNGTAGLLARYTGDDPTTASYYRYRIIKESFADSPKQVLEKVEQGVAVRLVELPGPGFVERQWNVLALEVVGGELTVRLNGQVVVEASDPTPLPRGQAGIYTRAIGGIFFDDFVVTGP